MSLNLVIVEEWAVILCMNIFSKLLKYLLREILLFRL